MSNFFFKQDTCIIMKINWGPPPFFLSWLKIKKPMKSMITFEKLVRYMFYKYF